MGALGQDRAQHCGPSWYPCHNLSLVMSFCNPTRRVYHWAQGQQIVAKQHVMGRLYGASHMAISYPELSFGVRQWTETRDEGKRQWGTNDSNAIPQLFYGRSNRFLYGSDAAKERIQFTSKSCNNSHRRYCSQNS
jgi:hypothetical protein